MHRTYPSTLGTVFLLVLTPLALSGCSVLDDSPRFRLKADDIVVSTSAEESMQAVSTMPTKFTVKAKDENAAWSRANFFLTQYTHSKKVTRSEIPGGTRLSAGTASAEDRYAYEVKKIKDSRGTSYAVRCVLKSPAGKVDALADRNARNLARFIKTGELELGILSQ